MDFARSVAHPFVLNPGAPTGFADNTLGGSDEVSPYVAIPAIWEKSALCVLLMQRVGK